MLAALGRRTPAAAGSRIGSVSAWLTKLEGILGADAMAAAAGVSEAAVKQFRRRSSGVMVYFDRDNCTPTATAAVKDAADVIQPPARLGKDGAGLKVTGTPQDVEGATAMTGGSILDFECVMTTGRRDRDGDVLDPKGAILDAKMPLLWQHLPFSPVGRMVKTLDHSDEKVAGKFMVANTELGNDVATLIDAGCLRISHGFAPIEYNPLKDEQGKDMGGWRISKYAMMECSVVSIPSNVDAEITAFSRGKLHHPLTKSFAKVLFDARPLLVSVLPAAKAKAVAAAVKGKPPAAQADPVDDDEDEEDTDKAGDDAEDDDEEDDTDPTDGAVDLTGATEDGDVLEDAEDDDTPDDPSDLEGEDAPAEGRPLADVLAAVAALGKGLKDLPKEAAGRIALVQGMFEDIDAGISAAADAVVAAAKGRDIVGMCNAMAAMTDGCTANLGRAAEELERLQGIGDLPDAVGTAVGDILADANAMVAAVSALSGEDAAAGTGADDPGLADMAADNAEDEAEGEEDKDGDGDELSDDDIDAERYGAEEDDDDEKGGDAEDDEEAEVTDKADEDDEREEKEDDEDMEEKGTDDEYDPEAGDEENPEAEAAGGPNPGVPAKGRRRLSDVLARSLLGDPTTPDERRALRQRLGSLAAD